MPRATPCISSTCSEVYFIYSTVCTRTHGCRQARHGAVLSCLVYTCGVIGTCSDTSSILDTRCDVKYDDKWSLLACKTHSATRCRAHNRTTARDRPHREICHQLLFNGAAGALVRRVHLLGAVKCRLQQRRIPTGSTHESGKPAELRENADDGRQGAWRRGCALTGGGRGRGKARVSRAAG